MPQAKPVVVPSDWVWIGEGSNLLNSGRIKYRKVPHWKGLEGEFLDCTLDGVETEIFATAERSAVWAPRRFGVSAQAPVASLTRPIPKPGEFTKDYDSRLAEYRARMKQAQPLLASDIVAQATSLGLRFVLFEMKNDFRELVLSVPVEAEHSKVSQLEAYAKNKLEDVSVRSVVFPYR